jgi:hypothetical protein
MHFELVRCGSEGLSRAIQGAADDCHGLWIVDTQRHHEPQVGYLVRGHKITPQYPHHVGQRLQIRQLVVLVVGVEFVGSLMGPK